MGRGAHRSARGLIAVLGLKSKSASKEKRPRAGDLFVVVQVVPGADPERFVGKPRPRDEAITVFNGVIRHADCFGPHTGAFIRVVSVTDWNQARVAEAVLES